MKTFNGGSKRTAAMTMVAMTTAAMTILAMTMVAMTIVATGKTMEKTTRMMSRMPKSNMQIDSQWSRLD